MTSPSDQPETTSGHMTIWGHLAELRTRIIRAVIAVAVGAVIGWIIYPWAISFLMHPFREINPDAQLFATNPLEPFATRIKVSSYLGIALAMPVILWQVWRFVAPGLYSNEKKYAIPFITSSLLLFFMGAAIAYWTLNPALTFLNEIGGTDITPIYSPDNYLMLIVWMMIAFGAGFEVPVLLVALELMNILHPRQLLSWWRSAVVVIAVVAAVITPSGDPISMLALAIPMVILYFGAAGIGAIALWKKKKKKSADAAGSDTATAGT